VGPLRLGGEHIEKGGFIGVVGTRNEIMWHPVTNTTATIPTSFIGCDHSHFGKGNLLEVR
jgi:hypothetical protein